MKNYIFCILFFISPLILFAQKENNNWYFGNKAGLSFNTEPPTALGDGMLNTYEGCAAISDRETGDLFFYTDGMTVWNRNHQVMNNGTGLEGDSSSTQSALIVPNPANNLEYYIFTTGSYEVRHPLSYSIVSLENPDGEVISKNNSILDSASEQLTGTIDGTGNGYWILTHHRSTNTFFSFHLDAGGLNNNPVISTYQGVTLNYWIGYLRISPNGKKIALASYISNALSLFDFDNITGSVSNSVTFDKSKSDYEFYGIAFSPDNTKLYSTLLMTGAIYQYDVSLQDSSSIINSRFTIIDRLSNPGSIALAPDGRIYYTNYGSTALSVINNPNESGQQCDVRNRSVALQGNCRVGLPNTMDYFLSEDVIFVCPGFGTEIGVLPVDGYSYSWSPTDGLDNPTIANPYANPQQTTKYTLTITDNSGHQTYRKFTVKILTPPKAKILPVSPICPGSNIQLLASGGVTYSWSPITGLDNPLIANPIASPKVTTRYKVIVTDGGCIDSAFVDVVVKPSLINKAGPDKEICFSGSVSIGDSAKLNEIYVWTPSEGLSDTSIANPVASPTITTSYILMVTRDSCISYDTVTVKVNDVKLTVSKDVTLCMGKSIRIWASGGDTYSWFSTDSIVNPTSPSQIVSPITTTIYKVIVSKGKCIDSAFVTVTVIPSVKANAGTDTTIKCAGQSIQIGATPETNLTYLWFPVKGLDDVKKANPIASPFATTKYRLIVSNGNCTDTAFVTVKVNQSSGAKAGIDKTVCPGSSTKIGSSPLQDYTYSWQPVTDLDDASKANPVCTIKSGSRQYILTVINSIGCISYDTVLVTVGNIVAKSSNDTAICTGSTVQLTAEGGSEYSWFPVEGLDDPTIPNPIASPDKTTIYRVRVSSGSCVDSAFIQVTVKPSPIANAGIDVNFCNDEMLQLGEPPVAGSIYSWQPTTGLDDPTKSNPNVTPDGTIQYILTVTNNNGCSAMDTVLVSVGNITAHVSGDTDVCLGSNVRLSASGGTNYQWSPIEGLDNPNSANPLCTPQSSIRYKVMVSSGNCIDSAFVTVSISPALNADAGKDTSVCLGSSVQLTASGGTNYLWSPSDGLDNPNSANPICTPKAPILYRVMVSSGNCIDSAFVNVGIVTNPNADAGRDTIICTGEKALIGVSPVIGNSYSWAPTLGLSNPNESQTFSDPVVTTSYILTVTNTSGCKQEDTVIVSVNAANEQLFTLTPTLITIQPGEPFQTILHVPDGLQSWNAQFDYNNLVVNFDTVLQTTNGVTAIEQKGKSHLSLEGTGGNGDVHLSFNVYVPHTSDTTFEINLTVSSAGTQPCKTVTANGSTLQLSEYCGKRIRMVTSTGKNYFLTSKEDGVNFGVGLSGKVQLEVYDYTGTLKQVLIDNNLDAGEYSLDFELPTGVYFCRLRAGMFDEMKKVMVVSH